MTTDDVLAEATDHAVTQAFERYPPLRLRPWQRLLLGVAGALIIFNSLSSGVLIEQTRHSTACQARLSADTRSIAQDDREAVDKLVKGLAAPHLTFTVRQRVVKAYLAQRAANDKRRQALDGDCRS